MINKLLNRYATHPSILKIKSNTTTKGKIDNNTIFQPVSSDEVRKLLQQLKPRKAINDNKIPPTLTQIAAEPLSTPFSIAKTLGLNKIVFLITLKQLVSSLQIKRRKKNILFQISAYRKSYNNQHVLINMIEEWRKNLLITKLSAYGFSSDHLCYIFSYLKDRKQCVQINNKQSDFDTVTSGVSQGSIFGLVLFNIFFQ